MKLAKSLALVLFAILTANSLSAHCQVPCGIFADELKFGELEQHIETIGKAGVKIKEISAKETLTANDKQQLIRWTMQKEAHAEKIIDEAANYFLAQRVKPGADEYSKKIESLHLVIVWAMKTKQSVEAEPVEQLSGKLAEFKGLYLAPHSH